MGGVTQQEPNEALAIRKRLFEYEQSNRRERERHDRAIAAVNAQCRDRHHKVCARYAVNSWLLGFLLVVVLLNLLLDAYLHATA